MEHKHTCLLPSKRTLNTETAFSNCISWFKTELVSLQTLLVEAHKLVPSLQAQHDQPCLISLEKS